MTNRRQAESTLRALGDQPDDAIDLGEGALALAALDHPRADLERSRTHIVQLAREVREVTGQDAGLDDRLAGLVDIIHRRHGYSGDTLTYEDLQNANLISVIERRKGLPVALGILYIQIARAQGWPADGLNFPGHFLIRLDADGERAIVDPFHDGQVRDAAELRELLKATVGLEAELDSSHYQPVGNRDILVRLQNNIKTRYLRGGQLDRAASVIDSMLLFAPDYSPLWHEAGIVQAQLGNLGAAIKAFEAFLDRTVDDRSRREVLTILRQLRNRLN